MFLFESKCVSIIARHTELITRAMASSDGVYGDITDIVVHAVPSYLYSCSNKLCPAYTSS